jgi:WD40 repeat protein
MIKTFYIFLFIFSSLSSFAAVNQQRQPREDRFIRFLPGVSKDPQPKAPVTTFEVDRNKVLQAKDLSAEHRTVLKRELLLVKPPEGPHEEINSLPSRHPAKRKIGNVPPPRPPHVTVTKTSLSVDILLDVPSSLLASLPAGDTVVALGHDLYIYKQTSESINIYAPAEEVEWYFTSVIYYHEYKTIAAGTSNGRILIFSSIGIFEHRRTLHTPGKVLSMSPNHYTKILAVASSAPNGLTTIYCHNLMIEASQVASWSTENISCLEFNPSGDTLASAGPSGIVRLWDIRKTDEPKSTFNPHKSSPINTIAWNPYRSHRIATASGSGREICVSNELSGKPCAKITATEAVTGLVWTRSGLLSAEGNQVHLRCYPDLENISWTCRQDHRASQIVLDETNKRLWSIYHDGKKIYRWDNLPIELEPKPKKPDYSEARAKYRLGLVIR